MLVLDNSLILPVGALVVGAVSAGVLAYREILRERERAKKATEDHLLQLARLTVPIVNNHVVQAADKPEYRPADLTQLSEIVVVRQGATVVSSEAAEAATKLAEAVAPKKPRAPRKPKITEPVAVIEPPVKKPRAPRKPASATPTFKTRPDGML